MQKNFLDNYPVDLAQACNEKAWSPLKYALSSYVLGMKDNKAVINVLIDAGADINEINPYSSQPLIMEIMPKTLARTQDLLELLLSKDADTIIADNDGDTVLSLALKMKNNIDSIVQMLQEKVGKEEIENEPSTESSVKRKARQLE